MRLYELADDPQLQTLIVAVDQLKQALDAGKIQQNWTLDQLLKYFSDHNIVLDPKDIYNMVQKPPMNKVISNVQGQEVVFKGLEPSEPAAEPPPPEQSKEVVAKMAKKAMK